MNHPHNSMDFDRLASLARTKPAVLERYLRFKVNQLIAAARPEARVSLRQLQFRIDSVRRRAKNPLAACIKISSMMHDEVWRLQQALNGCGVEGKPRQTRAGNRARNNVISLPKAARFEA